MEEDLTLEEKKKKGIGSFLKEYGIFILFLVLILLFKKYYYSPLYVHGDSMKNTLHDGDIMILDVVGYRHQGLQRFDIVVVDIQKEYIIKRVVGLPGEKVEYKDQTLYINGKKVKDEYGIGETEDFSYQVPKGQYFVLGDNRENSMDSRYFGSFSKKDILGKTHFILFPFQRFGNAQ